MSNTFDLEDIMPAPWDIPKPQSMSYGDFKEEWFKAFRPAYVPTDEEEAECIEAHKAYEDFVKAQQQEQPQS